MEIGASFVTGAEPLELVQPGESALDHPARLTQSGAVGDAASSGDQGFDAALAQQAAVLVEVIAPVGVQTPGFAAGASTKSRNRWDGSNSGRSWVTSCRLPPVRVTASGVL